MNDKILIEMSYSAVQALYSKYLLKKDIHKSTIATSKSSAFVIWREYNKETFWRIVMSKDSYKQAHDAISIIVEKSNTSNPKRTINGYLFHFRKFLAFYLEYFQNNNPLTVINSVKAVHYGKLVINYPTIVEVRHYLSKWNEMESYKLQESALSLLFNDLCPKNNSISEILLKSATLNDFYSTNIFSVFPVAKHILDLDIDYRLNDGDVSLVGDIMRVEICGKVKNFYSFASKYCSHHNPLEFPIYDVYVDRVLRHFRNTDGFSKFENSELKNYSRFKEILLDFCVYYKLEVFNLKQIDQYLWLLGKEFFPKKY